jgi:hypothetical protein
MMVALSYPFYNRSVSESMVCIKHNAPYKAVTLSNNHLLCQECMKTGYKSDNKLTYEKLQSLLTSKSLSEKEAELANNLLDSTNQQIDESEEYPFFQRERDTRDEFFKKTHEILYDIENKYVKELSEDGSFLTNLKPKELQSTHKELKEKCDKINEMIENGQEDQVWDIYNLHCVVLISYRTSEFYALIVN